jgi:hypothetical protein
MREGETTFFLSYLFVAVTPWVCIICIYVSVTAIGAVVGRVGGKCA